jgi:hypothetical protein
VVVDWRQDSKLGVCRCTSPPMKCRLAPSTACGPGKTCQRHHRFPLQGHMPPCQVTRHDRMQGNPRECGWSDMRWKATAVSDCPRGRVEVDIRVGGRVRRRDGSALGAGCALTDSVRPGVDCVYGRSFSGDARVVLPCMRGPFCDTADVASVASERVVMPGNATTVGRGPSRNHNPTVAAVRPPRHSLVLWPMVTVSADRRGWQWAWRWHPRIPVAGATPWCWFKGGK